MNDARTRAQRRPFVSLVLLACALSSAAPARSQATAAVPTPAGLPLPALPPDVNPPAYTPALTFDVASVRETIRNGQVDMGIVNPPHKSVFSANSVSLHILLQIAYDFGPFQIVGGPDWIDNRYFTVDAKADPAIDQQLAKLSDADGHAEKLHMLQAMLADRFHLRAHWEIRQQSSYGMTIARGGLKMQPTRLPVPQGDPTMAPTTPATVVHAHGGPQGIEIDGERFSMRAIALMLTTQLHTPVTDKTGDKGYYDFTFQFWRDEMGQPSPDSYPAITTAAQDELGLKLESSKGPVDVMVIDHAELPSAN